MLGKKLLKCKIGFILIAAISSHTINSEIVTILWTRSKMRKT